MKIVGYLSRNASPLVMGLLMCVPKNGDEPYVFSTTDTDGAVMWERGKEVSIIKK